MKKQKIVEYETNDSIEQTVHCAVCNHLLNLRSPKNPQEGLAYFDPFAKHFYFHKKPTKGAYVCYGCLSDKRKEEIDAFVAELPQSDAFTQMVDMFQFYKNKKE